MQYQEDKVFLNRQFETRVYTKLTHGAEFSWEVNRSSFCQEIPRIIWKDKFP